MSDLRAVALAYETAVTQGDPPRKFVQKVFGISASAAAKRIQMARRAGWIDPAAGQGRSPRRNKKLLAIAEELGVDYQALADAVRTHADGDLRVRL